MEVHNVAYSSTSIVGEVSSAPPEIARRIARQGGARDMSLTKLVFRVPT